MAVRLLITDDHDVVRQGLRYYLRRDPEIVVEERTVKAHVSSILRKLNLKSRTQAALYAVRTGVVSLDELGEESW